MFVSLLLKCVVSLFNVLFKQTLKSASVSESKYKPKKQRANNLRRKILLDLFIYANKYDWQI
jgi:hypothetical protein